MAEKKDNKALYSLAKTALCVSILAIVSWIVIPLPGSPVVLSLQTVAVNLTAFILSPGESFRAMTLYLIMGAVGLPVFSGGTAGPGKLFGPTGGYYFGFLLSAVTVSFLKGKTPNTKKYALSAVLAGIPIEHICAVIMMCIHNGWDIKGAFVSVSLPFILGDIVKAVMSAYLGVTVNRALLKKQH